MTALTIVGIWAAGGGKKRGGEKQPGAKNARRPCFSLYCFPGNFGDNCDNTTSDETNRSLLEVSLATRQSSACRTTDAGDYIK